MISRHSLTFRLTWVSIISTILIISGLSWLINNAIENHLLREDRFLLQNKIGMIKDVIDKTHFKNNFQEILKKLEIHEGLAIKINNPEDQISFYASDNIHFPNSILDGKTPDYTNRPPAKGDPENPQLMLISKLHDKNLIEWQDQDNFYRGMQVQFNFKNAKHSLVVLTLALNINHHQRFLKTFREVLVKFTLLAVFISALLQSLITYRGLLPLNILAKKAKLISGTDIKQRMPVDDLPVEIAELSETLNEMLERLEDAFQRLDNFSSDIAHELRTPINNVMMQAQVTLSQPRSNQEYQMTLGSNVEEFQRLARMISDMLFLAKADNKQLLLSQETILLDREIMDLFEFYDALAEESNIQLKLQGSAEVLGDRLMLRRAFNNLISNALHHSLEGSKIDIYIHKSESSAIVDVVNYGHSIPPEVLPYLFDRFYRADKARTCCSYERVGLGLAITQSIAKAHGGSVSVSSKNNVTTFTLTIKRGTAGDDESVTSI